MLFIICVVFVMLSPLIGCIIYLWIHLRRVKKENRRLQRDSYIQMSHYD